jgi:hypothetical protein
MNTKEREEIILQRVIARIQEFLVWEEVEGDEIAKLSLRYWLAEQEGDNVKRVEIKNIANVYYSPDDKSKFWTFASDLAIQILEEEVKRYEEEENVHQ